MYYDKQKLETLAEYILLSYYPNNLKELTFIDVYEFLEKIGCDYEWKYISPSNDILGVTCFENCKLYIWPNGHYTDGDYPYPEYFKKGTVIINQILLDNKDYKKERFVVLHEAMHWIKDKEYFSNYSGSFLEICTKDLEINNNQKNYYNDAYSIEWSTNYLAMAFLLPKNALKRKFFELLKYKNIPNEPVEYKKYMASAIRNISELVCINFTPVKYRLVDIGVLKKDNNA